MDLTCPYCNALFPAASAARSSRGLSCPRCGEPLPADLQAAATAAPQPALTGLTPTGTVVPSRRRVPNYLIGLAVLFVMVTVALIGLEFALRTQDFRRRNDFKVVQVKPLPLRAAAQWSGLGYLPTNANLLAGIQVSELVKDVHFAKFTALPHLVQFAVETLDKTAGLRFEDIDHVVAGVNLDTKLPQATIVVQMLKPVSPDAVANVLQATRTKDLHDQPLFAFRLTRVPGQGRLWCPDRHTAIFILRLDGVERKDLEELPFPPRSDNKGFAEPLDAVLDQRLGKQPLAWVAGHDFANQTLLPLVGKSLPVGGKELDLLTHVQTLGIALGEGRITGHLFTGDEENMRAAQKKLEALKVPTLRATSTPEGPDAFWISFQASLPEPVALKK